MKLMCYVKRQIVDFFCGHGSASLDLLGGSN